MIFVVLCPGTPKGSTGSGSGFKASHPTDWEKPGIEPATPGLQDIGLSPTPRRLLCRITINQPGQYYTTTNIKKKQSALCIQIVPRVLLFDPLFHVGGTISDETLSVAPVLLVILKLHTTINTKRFQ